MYGRVDNVRATKGAALSEKEGLRNKKSFFVRFFGFFSSMSRENSSEHTHADSKGIVHTCFHTCRKTLLDWSFWIGVTCSFPLEHFIWEKLWPFKLFHAWMDTIL